MANNEFALTKEYLTKILASNVCDYKSSTLPIIIRHHGRSLKEATTFKLLEGFPNLVMLAKDPAYANEVLDVYPSVKWAKDYYKEGGLYYVQNGALQYCRDNGYDMCVVLDDDLRDFTVSFCNLENGKMSLSSQKYFPYENDELSRKILYYCILRTRALFKKHTDIGMVGWHHRSFGYLYKNNNTVDINGGYNDFANGYIYNVKAIDKFKHKLTEEWDDHGENVGVYCDMLNRGMSMACLTGACISPNNDGDRSTLRDATNAKSKNDNDWSKIKKLTPRIVPGLRRQKTGEQYIKIDWKNMNRMTGKTHYKERLFYNPDDVITEEVKNKASAVAVRQQPSLFKGE